MRRPEAERTIKGIYNDRIIDPGGRVENRGWRSNVVVNRCRVLLAAFMSGDAGVEAGIRFIALGQGDPSWDGSETPSPEVGTEQLEDPSPVEIEVTDPSMEVTYLDAAGQVSPAPTHRIQVGLKLMPGTLTGGSGGTPFPLREFGLFGRLGGTGFMIDYVRHPVIHVGSGDTLERRIRLVF